MTSNEWAKEPDITALRSTYLVMRDDPARAITEFQALAQSGSLMSLVYMGYMFEEGLGVEKKPSEAREFYRRAFERGSISAAFRLGSLAWKEADYKKAQEYFGWGAEKNDPRAMYWLAEFHLRHDDSPDRFKIATELLERASSLGHLQSTRKLGKVLMRRHFGLAKFFRGLRLYVSTPFIAAGLVVRDPTSDRLSDLPFDEETRRQLEARQAGKR